MTRRLPLLTALLLVVPFAGCGDSGGVDLGKPVTVDPTAPAPTRLSEYNLFAWDPADGFSWNERVVPYDLNTPLFSDYALKQRAIYIPEGATATFDPSGPLDFPVGTVVVKSFYFPADFREPTQNLTLIETRVLLRRASGWEAMPYIWDAAQKDAILSPSGEVRSIPFIDAEGVPRTASYLVPQRNQCASCHEQKPDPNGPRVMSLIGPSARYLHRDYDFGGSVGVRNQLTYLAELGMLTGLPDLGTIDAAHDFRPIEANGHASLSPEQLDDAARTYLDINCAHCHSPTGVSGITSQLFLNHDNTDQFRLGVCKRPGSAGSGTGGFSFDIVPGNPDESILHFRMHTTDVGAMMPLVGRSLEHTAATALIYDWIAAMPANDCQAQ